MSYYVYNRVFCSNDFKNNYLIDPNPFGDSHPVGEEYITFNRICGADSLNDYHERFGEYIYYGFCYSIREQDDGLNEVKFATSYCYPAAAIKKAIELDHSVVWYAVGEELSYASKFMWSNGRVEEYTYDLETQEFYDWQDASSLWEALEDCDCEVWYYIDGRNAHWNLWTAEDIIARYRECIPSSPYQKGGKQKTDG